MSDPWTAHDLEEMARALPFKPTHTRELAAARRVLTLAAPIVLAKAIRMLEAEPYGLDAAAAVRRLSARIREERT